MPRLGMLMPGPAAHSGAILDPFYRGLHELGYIEGQNLAIERRDGDWKADRFPALAAELVGLKVDIIVAWSTPTARAAKQATNSIPIIAAVMADPVGDELVANLARPGGNVTGTTFLGPELHSQGPRCVLHILHNAGHRAFAVRTGVPEGCHTSESRHDVSEQLQARAGRRSRRFRKRILRDGEGAGGSFHGIA